MHELLLLKENLVLIVVNLRILLIAASNCMDFLTKARTQLHLLMVLQINSPLTMNSVKDLQIWKENTLVHMLWLLIMSLLQKRTPNTSPTCVIAPFPVFRLARLYRCHFGCIATALPGSISLPHRRDYIFRYWTTSSCFHFLLYFFVHFELCFDFLFIFCCRFEDHF